MLEESIAVLKGIGEARLKAWEKLEVCTVGDLLRFAPRGYQDFSRQGQAILARHGEWISLRLKVMRPAQQIRPKGGLQMVTTAAADETGKIQLVWYNQPYRARQVQAGEQYFFSGRVDAARGIKLVNPMISAELPGILPVYPLVQGLSQKHVRDVLRQALDMALPRIEETLPQYLREQYGLCGLQQALRAVHFPSIQEELQQARRRLSFEDMLYYLLAIAILKKERQGKGGIAFGVGGRLQAFTQSLPFPPTGAQRRVLQEIERDMAAPRPMNRLVQGDVGSGKTVLAFYALYLAERSGYQGVLMAPTELLAQQHYAQLREQYGEKAALLSGALKKKEREEVYARIECGQASIVVGTHALLQAGVHFHNLGVVVTDEQHRFGVRQRAAIANKSELAPDVLVMSATPIPRTLAMLLYGDLDLSVLDELPPGRRPVLTRIVPEERREDMYRFVQEQAAAGRQAYVVCPLVEPSEALEARSAQEVFAQVRSLLPALRIELLHGRMAAAKKEEAVARFRAGELDMLVSTTVVEVGVDVPNAAIMVIENANRFGLAQLHQLRGRVGRGAAQSFCFLLGGTDGEAAMERMQTMVKTNDGFVIAQKDLELRGPGEFLGTRQHGADEAQAARLAQNMDVLFEARRAADGLIVEGETAENAALFQKALSLYAARMKEIANN